MAKSSISPKIRSTRSATVLSTHLVSITSWVYRVIPCEVIKESCGHRLRLGLFSYITKSAKSESVCARTLGPSDQMARNDPTGPYLRFLQDIIFNMWHVSVLVLLWLAQNLVKVFNHVSADKQADRQQTDRLLCFSVLQYTNPLKSIIWTHWSQDYLCQIKNTSRLTSGFLCCHGTWGKKICLSRRKIAFLEIDVRITENPEQNVRISHVWL